MDNYICPICNAFQDPDTGRCLICGRTIVEIYSIKEAPKLELTLPATLIENDEVLFSFEQKDTEHNHINAL